ncbi:unnamed protein product [Amoebophrya sp. A120]|nr:unnamed protein product [Amoebophrya sp. A120]|eukprot:GSA120T00025233001.1
MALVRVTPPRRGWMCSTKHITLGAQSRGQKVWFRKFFANHKQWFRMKWHLNDLILKQRLHLTLPWAKELQQYAEDMMYCAKKNTPHYNGLVESMLVSSAARQILYEQLVPRYKDRPFFFTRLVNKWQTRERDGAPMGFLEFVDRPGEYKPARPVGEERMRYIEHQLEHGTRRERRIFARKALRTPDFFNRKRSETVELGSREEEDGAIGAASHHLLDAANKSGGAAVRARTQLLRESLGEDQLLLPRSLLQNLNRRSRRRRKSGDGAIIGGETEAGRSSYSLPTVLPTQTTTHPDVTAAPAMP